MAETFTVGAWTVEPDRNTISSSSANAHLEPKAMEVLVRLAESPGETVSKDELIKSVWPGTFVSDDVLSRCVYELRKAFGDESRDPHIIETVPKRGYRLIAPVEKGRLPPQRTRLGHLFVCGLATVLALAATVIIVRSVQHRPAIRRIAVLPFSNLSGDPSQEYFADGMTEALITHLEQVKALTVISRTSTKQYRSSQKPLREIARELNVDGIVEGSVFRSSDRVRVSARLVEAATDARLWSESYEREMKDVLAMQVEMAREITRHIRVAVTPTEANRLTAAPSTNSKSYELYLQGRYQLERRDVGLAAEKFAEAIALDPSYAEAYAALAATHSVSLIYGDTRPEETAKRASTAARDALQLDPNIAEAHAAVAFVKTFYEWDWRGAEEEFQRALELNPGDGLTHLWYGCELLWLGRFEAGTAQIRRAQEIAPASPSTAGFAGMAMYVGRNFEGAIAESKKATRLDSSYVGGHAWLGLSYVARGETAKGVQELEDTVKLMQFRQTRTMTQHARLAYAYALAGRRSEAQAILQEMTRASATRYIPAVNFAIVYAGLGNKERAISWLDKAYAERSFEMVMLKVDPRFDSLRLDSRFQSLLARMNFPK